MSAPEVGWGGGWGGKGRHRMMGEGMRSVTTPALPKM